MKIQRDNSVIVGEGLNNIELDDTPPVKDRGPVSNLEFDFVVNNDALIIYLKETPEKIEKTIVNLSVDGIYDLNGNQNESPITWSAYIDRNKLKWGEIEMNVEKPMNKGVDFVVKAVNKGGANENFIIQNMPSWMQISPTSGTIKPNSTIDVNFHVDEGLNVGAYDENIFLTNNDNVSEVLAVTVKARGIKPDWKVIPGRYNMTVYGKLRINNIFSNDPEDIIAAFSKGVCVGLAYVQYEKRNDMWYAFLTVTSDIAEDVPLDFKIWDASTGTVYLANPGDEISFTQNTVIGSPADPRIFNAIDQIYQNIDLQPGWNWISFNTNSSALSDQNGLLANMQWDQSNFFKSETDNISANYSVIDKLWKMGNSITLNNTVMYKLSSSVAQTLSVAGSRIIPSSATFSIAGKNWTYLSYLPTVRLKLDEALAGYDAMEEDIIKTQNGFAMYSSGIGWVGSLMYMQPGKGYMLYRNNASTGTLKYPDSYGTLISKSNPETTGGYVNVNFPANMNLIAVSDIPPQENDRIIAYTGTTLSSKTELQNTISNGRFFITVSGSPSYPVIFELERNGVIVGRTAEIPFIANTVKGSIANPYLLEFKQADDALTAFPNPVINDVTLALFTRESGPVNILITDISGKVVIEQKGEDVIGNRSVNLLNLSALKPGVYFVKVAVQKSILVTKIVKQ